MESKVFKKTGIKDIARKANVSVGTVDRVLHNRADVNKETRAKVLQIVDEMGYTPNLVAKTLASKKIIHIAVVIPESSDDNPYWQKPVIGLEKAQDELVSYNTGIFYEFFNASSELSFTNALENVYQKNPDGIILDPVFRQASLDFITKLDSKGTPYIFIDVNIENVGNLAYFGQNAEQSGKVAARLMDFRLKDTSSVLIIKQAVNKVFSQHIESRIEGFKEFFKSGSLSKNISFQIIEIDISKENEPDYTLKKVFSTKNKLTGGIFVPNSRVFKLADYMVKYGMKGYFVVGYDLLEQNVDHIRKGNIHCLINQRPEEQAYKAIMTMFNFLQNKKQTNRDQYSPIDIIVSENIDFIS